MTCVPELPRCQELTNSQSRDHWLHIISQLINEFGFSYVLLMEEPSPSDTLLEPIILESTAPADFLSELDRQHLLSDYHRLTDATPSLLPLYWSLDEGQKLSPQSRALEEFMEFYGILNGVVAPVTSSAGKRYLFRFDGLLEKPDQRILTELGAVASRAFEVYDRIRDTEILLAQALTRREVEIIRWASLGKTSNEIGGILSLSGQTVNGHLTNAIRKANCVNRTQLVAKAIRLKIIA